jgi:hypothetical protein
MKLSREAQGDDQDVDYEEVKCRELIFLNRVNQSRCKSEAFQNKCRDVLLYILYNKKKTELEIARFFMRF